MSTRCRVCHRALNRPDTMTAGIGLTCARKLGYLLPKTIRKMKALGKPLFDLKAVDLGVPLFPDEGGEK